MGSDATQSFTLTVSQGATITSANNTTFTVGTAGTFTVTATGAPTPTLSETGALPSGVTFTSSTGVLAGTPAAGTGGSYAITFTAHNGAGSDGTQSFTLAVNQPAAITSANNATFAVGASGSFTVKASGFPAPTISESGALPSGVTFNSTTGVLSGTPAAGTTGSYSVTFTAHNGVGTDATQGFTITVNALAPGTDVMTFHNDIARTGQNLTETVLTQANVNSQNFGLLRNLPVDGKVDAEPLYLSHLTVGAGTYNVVLIATEHDSVYAFESDTGTQLWKVSLLGSGETTSDDRGCTQVMPEIGVTSTPVIDRTAGAHGIMYVVAMSKNGSTYIQRMHALDVTTGAELLGGPVVIQATYPGTGDNSSGGQVIFDPAIYKERAALLLFNGVVYTTWASHCDDNSYTGWVIGYSSANLTQASVLNLVPNGSKGAIWQSGGGPAVDPQGNIYILDGNGTFDTTLDMNGFPIMFDYGNGFVKIATSGATPKVVDYFNMKTTADESNEDIDLGSAGPMVLPDQNYGTGSTLQLVIGAGKDGNIYLLDRTNMGKFSPSGDSIYQELSGVLPNGIFGVPAYFNSTVYYCNRNGTLKAFSISNGKLSTTPTQTSTSFTYPGGLPSISANGTGNGIVWIIENTSSAILHAYPAGDLTHELYNSTQATGGRDTFGTGNKFITPMIADGKVFAATTNSVAVFGLLH